MSSRELFLPARDYDLAGTLDSGQVFRWQREGEVWTGVLGRHRLRLTSSAGGIHATADSPVGDWGFLREFLQVDVDLADILKTFPDDDPMRAAVASCRGLRLLRQDPWECLASFILSATKQIVQIRQIVALLCERFGEPCFLPTSASQASARAFAFPTPERLAALSESELRACKMGFRAPHLHQTAQRIAAGQLNLEAIRTLDYDAAREQLMTLRGVGKKIADCVLLFGYGFETAFPVDVWIERALQELYFRRRRASEKRLHQFASTHFGPHAGYAQQYLFHYMRTSGRSQSPSTRAQPKK